jgi:hypothetical protein
LSRSGFLRLACGVAAIAVVVPACHRRSEPPSASADALLFRIEALPDAGGTRKAWLATYDAGGRTARFHIELDLKAPGRGSPFTFTSGAFVREPGSDGTQLMSDLARALGGTRPAPSSNGVERLAFEAALLGRDLSRGRGSDQYAGAFTSSPKGTWIATKVFLADGEGEVFLNLDPVGGWGEFAAKEPEYARSVLGELSRVLQGEAAAGSTAGGRPAPDTAGPAVPSGAATVDPLAPILAKLMEANDARRVSAIADLRRLKEGGSALQPDLIALTGDSSQAVSSAALLALPEIGGDKANALDAARAAVRHPNPVTRVRAAQTLAALGEPSVAVVYLIAFLDGPARTEAAHALGTLGPQAKSAVPHLTEMLKQRRDPNEGYAAAMALAAMGEAAAPAIPALQAAATAPDRTVSQAARYALDQIGSR